MGIAEDYEQHCELRTTDARDGKIYKRLLIGTAAQIGAAVSTDVEGYLRTGHAHEISLRPIHPVDVVRLSER